MYRTAYENSCSRLCFFFFNDTATTEIYTLSLHDALPIPTELDRRFAHSRHSQPDRTPWRSEEHTSELQSRVELVCRLLREKKKKTLRTRVSRNKRRSVPASQRYDEHQ